MAATAELGSDVMAIGSDIESFAALDFKADGGQVDFKQLVVENVNQAGLSFNGFTLSG